MRQIACVGEDGQIYLVDLDLGTTRLVSDVRSGSVPGERQVLHNWPTWSPNGQRLAFFRFEIVDGEVQQSRVQAVAADGSDLRDLYRGGREGGPIYMCWSPDGRRLAILVQEAGQLHLQVAHLDGAASPIPVAHGAPLYFVWRPDSRGLVAHVGPEVSGVGDSRLLWIELEAGRTQEVTLRRRPVPGFRAPTWSERLAGTLFALDDGSGGAEIVLQGAAESDPTTVVSVGLAPAFVLSPTGEDLAYSAREATDSPLYQGLWVYDLEDQSRRQITEEPLLAFFWCPDGGRLVCTTGDIGNRTVALRLIDAGTGAQTELGWVRPTRDLWLLLGHFDQYAHSSMVFSPVGDEMVLASSQAQERQNGSVPTVRRVLVRSLTDPDQEVVAARGRLAFWRPTKGG